MCHLIRMEKMMQKFSATRKLGIDAAHRVSSHGSKCRNLHGHRYEIEATCSAGGGVLRRQGEQLDMVVDFSFLKEEMIGEIEGPCDHGLITAVSDDELLKWLCKPSQDFVSWKKTITEAIETRGYFETDDVQMNSKVYIIGHQPTAERLAEHWFGRLAPRVHDRSEGRAKLTKIRVWETPNCFADFRAPEDI